MNIKIQDDELKDFYKIVGNNVAKARKKKGISQIELANALGHTSRTIISLAEVSHTKHFNLEHLYKISKFLQIDLCELIKVN